MADPTTERDVIRLDSLWAKVETLPVLRLKTRKVVGGSGPDTYEPCIRVADLRAAGLFPPLPPPVCVEEGCDLPRVAPVGGPIWCEPHRDAAYVKQQSWLDRRRPAAPSASTGIKESRRG